MKKFFSRFLMYSVLSISTAAAADTIADTMTNTMEIKEQTMNAEGTFEVKLDPAKDEQAPAGRMIIQKTYSGDLVGTGAGQMLSKRTDKGTAVYSAIEEFEGSVQGKSGAFTLLHNGFMSKEEQTLEVKIVPGSGQGELEGIEGSLDIVQKDGKHFYVLIYEL